MSNNEWVQEGTPRDDAEWTEETDEYGVPVEPAEWDDYSNEQAMPVPPRPVQPEPVVEEPAADDQVTDEPVASDDVSLEEPVLPIDEHEDNVTRETAPDPDDVVVGEDEPVAATDQVDDADQVDAEASVFDDHQPVAPADEDVTREVADAITAEQQDQYHDDESIVDDAPTDEVSVHDDEPVERTDEEPIFEDEDPVFEEEGPRDDEPVLLTADDEPVADDEIVADEPVVEEGATRVDPDDLEETALVDQVDDDPTTVREAEPFDRAAGADPTVPVLAGASGAAGAALAAPGAMAGLYRGDSDETQVLETTGERRTLEDEAREEEARAAALRAEKQERDRRLGMVQTSTENAERELRPRRKGVGPFGSFGLFVLRLITAAILGIVAYQVLYSIDATAEFLTRQPLIPEPRLVAWILGFTLAAMAVMLVIGLGVRVVGLVLAALAIAALALVRWGSFSPFVDGMEGFLGDKDLLLAGVGILFLSLGGGRFGIDGVIARSREEAREARRA